MRQIMQRTFFLTAILITLVFAGTFSVKAQHGYRVSKRITFKKGEISTTLKSTIAGRLEGHEYFFRVRQGQTVLIRLISNRQDVTFYLMDKEGNSMAEEVELREWTGELPETGDYRLVIGTKSKGAATYTLKVQIAADI